MQNEPQHKAEPALCVESAVQQQSRMRRVASADYMKGNHRRRPRKLDNVAADAAAMQADATAPRVPSTQCMILPTCEARTEPLADSNTRLDGCWDCLPSKPASAKQR